MSRKSRSDAWGTFFLNFGTDDKGQPIDAMPESEIDKVEAELHEFFRTRGFVVRALTFDVKDGRFAIEERSDP